MKTSEKFSGEASKDLVAAIAAMPATVKRDGKNPHFGSKYATLQALTAAWGPVFAKNNRAPIFSGFQPGPSPKAILAALANQDPGHQTRQYGIVDTKEP